MSDFQSTIAVLEQTMKDARETARNAFMGELKKVFANHPELKVMTWTQYTPYFNDGDTCTFDVNSAHVSNYESVSPWGEWDDEEEDEPDDFFVIDLGYGREANRYPVLKELNKFMQSQLGNDVLEFAFGDHVQVKVTATGIDVSEYDHD